MMRHYVFDLSTIVGIGLALAFAVFAAAYGGNITAFFDLPSLMLVFFGTLALTLACFSFGEFAAAIGLVGRTVFYPSEDLTEATRNALEVAEIARKKGFLALQNLESGFDLNRFFRKGMEMVVDGTPIEEMERILRQEIDSMAERHDRSAAVLRKAAEISPAMGLIGTMIGLVQMLGSLDDPSKIGAAMGLALLTTLYGAMMSYMFFAPLSNKLERNNAEETLLMRVYFTTVSSISRKENPRRLEMLINALLPPAKRIQYFA